MSVFMHNYIEQIVNVKGNSNHGFQAVFALLDKGEKSHTLVRHTLIQELRSNKDFYTQLFENKEKVEELYHSLVPCISGPAPEDEWKRFPEIGHLIEIAYERVCIDLTRYGFSEAFFPLRIVPPPNPNDRIICVGWVLNLRHFVQVSLKLRYFTPLTSPEWTTHNTIKVETWPDQFVERLQNFTKLNKIEREINKEKSKGLSPIDLASVNN
ncbi:uncharacterized protein LOC131650287 [Vicia villosa]|uniref:uncharacterized protein LOC131650287 n=1 Tax=Vicia villosa TaxID=3911 RepID=UPI00273BA390|nr:uncharacterized protein LOC131650287 [Vicia villosa]